MAAVRMTAASDHAIRADDSRTGDPYSPRGLSRPEAEIPVAESVRRDRGGRADGERSGGWGPRSTAIDSPSLSSGTSSVGVSRRRPASSRSAPTAGEVPAAAAAAAPAGRDRPAVAARGEDAGSCPFGVDAATRVGSVRGDIGTRRPSGGLAASVSLPDVEAGVSVAPSGAGEGLRTAPEPGRGCGWDGDRADSTRMATGPSSM